MSLSPGSSAQRGDISVQPEYYTSSLFVEPLRRDLESLIQQYSAGYAEFNYPRPFEVFKSFYYELGWNWLHLRELERRARNIFLQTVMRIILERADTSNPPLTRVIALFTAYIFFFTQPFMLNNAIPNQSEGLDDSQPSTREGIQHTNKAPLIPYSIGHILVPNDLYKSIISLPTVLIEPALVPLQPHVTHIIKCFVEKGIFYIAPHSELHPLDPRQLPHAIYVQSSEVSNKKKTGRPTHRSLSRKAKSNLRAVEEWVSKDHTPFMIDGSNEADLRAVGRAEEAEKRMLMVAAKQDLDEAVNRAGDEAYVAISNARALAAAFRASHLGQDEPANGN